MSSITIRNLDEDLKARLRLRAARHGLSMEQEVRNILQRTLAAESAAINGLDFAKRNALAAAAATIFEEDFEGRCFNFDRFAAACYA